MPPLTVELVKIINLQDDNVSDKADPYVKFELVHNKKGFWKKDETFDNKVSSKKQNERNPIYYETFVFDDIETLTNMELRVVVMDDDFGRSKDDKLGSCTIQLDKLELEPIPALHRRKIDDNIFAEDAYIFLKLSYGEAVEDVDATKLSYVGTAAYDCLRTLYSEYHHTLWNVSHGKVVGELHQTPKLAFPGPPSGESFPKGHDDWFPSIMGDILSRTKVWADVLSLGPPDGKFMTAFQDALLKISQTAQGKKSTPVIIRMMFG